MEPQELMFELSHAGRLKTLNLLIKEPMRLSHLAKKLDITTAEASRHLSRLSRARLIEKQPDSSYTITSFGKIILGCVRKAGFFLEDIDYFLDHDIETIPKVIRYLDPLAEGQTSKGTMENVNTIQVMTREAEEFVNLISDQPLGTVVEYSVEKAKEGLELRFVYKEGSEIPKEYLGLKNLSIRTIEKVSIAVKFNEKRGGIALSDNSGKVDFETVIVGDSERFLAWLGILFNYYWEQGKIIQ